VTAPPLARHLLRARDLVDSRYAEPLDLDALARAAHVSPRHFSRCFRRTFGETPHQYLLTRRMERASALLRNTDHSVLDICLEVGLQSVGSFTSSFKRTYGVTPTDYRAAHPPQDVYIPTCYWMAAARPPGRALLEKTPGELALSVATDQS
jgi:AraC-like DNA-binding protein